METETLSGPILCPGCDEPVEVILRIGLGAAVRRVRGRDDAPPSQVAGDVAADRLAGESSRMSR